MADVNHVTIIGRLTRDAELKYTSAGMGISNFSIAVNRRRKSGDQWIEEANFFEINLYGKSAESLKPYLVKGKQIAVEGELRQDRWEQDGQPRSKVVITASNIQLLGGNSGSGNGGGYAQEGRGAGAYAGQNNFAGKNTFQQRYDAPSADSYDSDSSAYSSGDGFPEDIPF
ncbi:MAG: single-stranded DNA-binding protein [Bacteroides sp.]|nr:single-stranded DNA-binding protein [Prevotella sp.]MCM1408215.1 single-stranded DNA-binding protein [Treponema brennaborense]MCM1469539.1 single-stranded DNA-binding protein [Bacteroides sp.]